MASSLKKQIKLFTNIDMLLMIEKGMGGHDFSGYVKFNNKHMKAYDKNKES